MGEGPLETLENDHVQSIPFASKLNSSVVDGGVREGAMYRVERPDLERIEARDTIVMRLTGTNGSCDVVPKQEALAGIGIFVDSIMGKEDSASATTRTQ